MYQPASFTETRLDVLHAVMRAAPLASLVIHGPDGLDADPLPLLLDAAAGPYGTLAGHCARANPLWTRAGTGGIDALAIFHGPEHYVSPAWYPAKQEHGRVVPTWNYVIVQARGRLRAIDDRDWLRRQVTALTQQQEAGSAAPWAVGDAPADYLDRMLGAIVGLELRIERLSGKCKLSQNQPAANRDGVIAGLQALGTSRAAVMAAEVAGRMTPPRAD